jgi:hypothetical protein
MLSLNCTNVQHVKIYLPCNFEVNPITHFGVIALFNSPGLWAMWAIAITFRPFVNFSHFNLLLRNHWANCNQTLVEWSLDGPLPTKLWWNGPWMAPFQNCVRWSRLPTKMATKLKIEKRGDEILIVHCCFNISQN